MTNKKQRRHQAEVRHGRSVIQLAFKKCYSTLLLGSLFNKLKSLNDMQLARISRAVKLHNQKFKETRPFSKRYYFGDVLRVVFAAVHHETFEHYINAYPKHTAAYLTLAHFHKS